MLLLRTELAEDPLCLVLFQVKAAQCAGHRLFKERCCAELQQILEGVGVRGLWKRKSCCISIGWAHKSRVVHGLVMECGVKL